MTSEREIVIVGAARTPMGAFQGGLARERAPALGAAAISGALAQAGLAADSIDEVVMGCVLPAGLGQAPARQAALRRRAARRVGALRDPQQGLRLGHEGGDARARPDRRGQRATSWSPAAWRACRTRPICSRRRAAATGMGHGGSWTTCSSTASRTPTTRAADGQLRRGHRASTTSSPATAQDEYALGSLERAQAAIARGQVRRGDWSAGRRRGRRATSSRAGETREDPDAEAGVPRRRHGHRRELLVDLRRRRGAGADAASRGREAAALTPLARIVGHASHAQAPAWFTTAPVVAIRKLLEKARLAASPMSTSSRSTRRSRSSRWRRCATSRSRDDKVNVHGGACALGHPIGARARASSSRCCTRCAHAACARRRLALHRRRRGDGGGGGNPLIGPIRGGGATPAHRTQSTGLIRPGVGSCPVKCSCNVHSETDDNCPKDDRRIFDVLFI